MRSPKGEAMKKLITGFKNSLHQNKPKDYFAHKGRLSVPILCYIHQAQGQTGAATPARVSYGREETQLLGT